MTGGTTSDDHNKIGGNGHKLINPPSMAQLEATQAERALEQHNENARDIQFLDNSESGARQQVATPDAFGNEFAQRKADDEEDFFLDEDTIGSK